MVIPSLAMAAMGGEMIFAEELQDAYKNPKKAKKNAFVLFSIYFYYICRLIGGCGFSWLRLVEKTINFCK